MLIEKLQEKTIKKAVEKFRIDWARSDAERDKGLTEPDDVKAYIDIRYGEHGDYNLLDVYVPTKQTDELLPVLVNIHGGGYFYGDKNLYRFYAMDMVQDGFAVININYRISPENKFPAALQDINETFCWLENHAQEYKMDLSRVFMMGDSAGAQLVSHYAAINSNKEFASLYAFKNHNIKIKGISLACGMYDLINMYKNPAQRGTFLAYLKKEDAKNKKKLDVLGAINSSYPPAFLFSCPNDFLVGNCEPMANLITSRGGKATVKIYGTKEMKDIAHVFHCNLRSKLGELARRDQARFLLTGKI